MKHPLEKFKYCPVCGSAHFVVNNFKSKKYAEPRSLPKVHWT
jgi:transposase-like protein